MSVLDRALVTTRAIRAIATGRRVPIIVSWNITYRCNYKCRYCGTNETTGKEADTGEVLAMAAELARLGARFVGFSGGEPLLRPDFPTIVSACRDLGLRVSVQTNGTLVRERMPHLSGLNEVRVSLDGPREVQDSVRGAGAFDAAVEAVRTCQERGVSVLATAVLTRRSLATLRGFLDLLADLDLPAVFQPMDARFASHLLEDDPLWPDPRDLRAGVDLLLSEKGRGSSYVLNSLAGLRYMRGWPDPDPIPCHLGRSMVTVDVDGRVFVCDMYPDYRRHLVHPGKDPARVVHELSLPSPCPRCITGTMADLNLAASGRTDVVFGLLSRLWKVW